jgi:hypothetical protein
VKLVHLVGFIIKKHAWYFNGKEKIKIDRHEGRNERKKEGRNKNGNEGRQA